MIVNMLKKFKGNLVNTCTISPLLGYNIPSALKLNFLGSFYKNDLFEAKFGGVKFFFRWKDFFMVNEVLVQSEYKYVLNLIKEIQKPLIIDLGANIGTFSIYLLKHFPEAFVHAYEASADTYSVLEKNRKENPSLNWNVVHSAVWKEDGFISFETKEFSGSSHVHLEGKETVPAVKLSTVLEKISNQKINLMKIDIEGAEEAVLLNQGNGIFAQIENLIIELHPKACDTKAIVNLLRENFDYLYEMPDRKSSKPLLIATRQKIDLPVYTQ